MELIPVSKLYIGLLVLVCITVDLLNDADLELIRSANEKADVVIVGVHWGVEYTDKPTRKQREWAEEMVDAGADVIIGHHPHWVQDSEIIDGVPVYYSLGNFVFDQMWSEETKYGVVGKYTFYDNELIDAEYSPVYIKDFDQPSFLEGDAKNKIIEMMYQESIKLQ